MIEICKSRQVHPDQNATYMCMRYIIWYIRDQSEVFEWGLPAIPPRTDVASDSSVNCATGASPFWPG